MPTYLFYSVDKDGHDVQVASYDSASNTWSGDPNMVKALHTMTREAGYNPDYVETARHYPRIFRGFYLYCLEAQQ